MIRKVKSLTYIAALKPLRLLPTLAAAAMLVMPPAAAAQDWLPRLDTGVRARLTLQEQPKRPFVGNISFSTPDMIGIVHKGDTVNVARGELRQIDVSSGRSAAHGAAKGAAWGALVGAVAMTFGVATEGDTDFIVLAPIVGIIYGGGIGAVVGALWRSERWETRWVQPVR
jgi:hypothetical protein